MKGSIKCIQWQKGTPGDRTSGYVEKWLKPGESLEVPANTPHAVYADKEEGCIFHEVVGDFKKRGTIFFGSKDYKLEADGYHIVGSDGIMRFYPQKVVEAFSGKTVVITGCSRGLGLELTEQLLACQARVIATCRNPEKAPNVQRAIEFFNNGDQAFLLTCDVSDMKSIKALGQLIPAKCAGSVDVLINNAGISSSNHPHDPIISTSLEDMQSVFQTNVMGTVLVTQEILPFMKDAAGQPNKMKMIMNMSS